jgi:tripartite-type tricarboxylate transporter receptor subunit TctC
MMKMLWKRVLAGLPIAALVATSGAALSQAPGLYKDKLINVVVAGGAAGGHARIARMVGPYLQKHSGAREVRITFMPGGGGLIAANQLVRTKPDGFSVVFGNIPTLIVAPIAGSEGVQFDTNKFVYLGRATNEPRVLAVGGKSALKTIQDVVKLNRQFVFPTQGTDEDFYTMAIIADALGFKMKAVTGYEGNADTTLAVIKGDGDGHITSWSESDAPIKAGDKRPILIITSQRVPEHPDVPTLIEITPAAKQANVRAMVGILETGRSYIGPPGMDAKAVAAFRAAVAAAMADPALIDESTKSARPLSFMDGAKQQQTVEQIAKASAGLAPVLKAAVQEIR